VTGDSRVRRRRFLGKSIDLPEDLSEAQLDGRACIRCGAEDQPMHATEAWSEQSAQLFEFECPTAEAVQYPRKCCSESTG
jgi:hypothetical protein